MRIAAISLLCLATLTGCMSVHADLPEGMVRHLARKDGMDIGATCSNEGLTFSEGAIVCMADHHMVCDPSGRWVLGDRCS